MTVLLAIDPGPVQSAWVVHNSATGAVRQFNISANEWLAGQLRSGLAPDVSEVVIEKVEGYGMPVGVDVFETVYWSGRFAEAAWPLPVTRIGRKAIKIHLCGSLRAKDPNIRQALLDRYGGSAAKGTKAQPGPLYGVSRDVWSALAVAVTWADHPR